MKNLLSLSALVLALVSVEASADRLRARDVSVDVVNARGWELPTYSTRGEGRRLHKAYVEARPGQSYGIRVTNHSPERLAFVIAVDGRNIISGKRSDLKSHERKYVLGPYESAVYRGWRASRHRVNQFYFTDQHDSYSAAFNDYSAMGVIAVATFRDRDRRYEDEYHYDTYKRAPQAESGTGSSRHKSAPGTGYGETRYSNSRRVRFDAERRASAVHLFKYEWGQTLCERGISRCYASHNRLWDSRRRDYGRGYAPPPPRYRTYAKRDDDRFDDDFDDD